MLLKISKGKKVTYSLNCVFLLLSGYLCAFQCFQCFQYCQCFQCFQCFYCFQCVRNLFVKRIKNFKTALITSFILLVLSHSSHAHTLVDSQRYTYRTINQAKVFEFLSIVTFTILKSVDNTVSWKNINQFFSLSERMTR